MFSKSYLCCSHPKIIRWCFLRKQLRWNYNINLSQGLYFKCANVTGIPNLIWFKQIAIFWSTWRFLNRLLQVIDSGQLDSYWRRAYWSHLSATIIWYKFTIILINRNFPNGIFTVIGYWPTAECLPIITSHILECDQTEMKNLQKILVSTRKYVNNFFRASSTNRYENCGHSDGIVDLKNPFLKPSFLPSRQQLSSCSWWGHKVKHENSTWN